jgi:hypothetical protein
MAAGELTDEDIGYGFGELTDADIGYGGEPTPEQRYVPIPPIIPPRSEPQRPDHLRPGYEMTGGMVGGALGAPAGPAGVLGGGALGAMAGSAIYDLTQDAAGALGLTEPQTRAPGAAERLQNMGAAGRGDFVFGGIGQMAGPVARQAGKGVKSWALGLNTQTAREAADLALGQNIRVGPIHISPRKWVRGYAKVVGVFPFVGTPLRDGQARVVGDLDERAADLLNTLAPRTSLDIGEEMTRAAERGYKRFRSVGAALYGNFEDVASRLSVADVVPTRALKETMAEYGERAARTTPVLQSGTPMRSFGQDALGEWLQQVNDLPEHITVEQARGLQRQLNGITRNSIDGASDFARVTGMRDAVRQAINEIDVGRLPAEEAGEVKHALDVANSFWAENANTFQTATAKRFGRVNSNIFEQAFFKAGSLDRDEIFKAVFRSGSADAVLDLRKLVGGRIYNKAVRSYLDDAFQRARVPAKEGATIGEMFSAQKLERILNIEGEGGREVLHRMLSHTPLNPRDLERFLKAAKTASDITIRDPSSFVARRATLGGATAVLGGLAIGAGKVSLPKAALMSYILRQFSKGLVDPSELRRLTRGIADNATEHQKRALIMRFLENWRQNPAPDEIAPPTD